MIKNDKKWQSVIMTKSDKNDKKWHKRDPNHVPKLMWYLKLNYSAFKMLKNAKKVKCDGPTYGLKNLESIGDFQFRRRQKNEKNDLKWHKMSKELFENDANDLNTLKTSERQSKWLHMIKNDKKWQSVIMTKSDKEWQKMTQKGP